MREGTLFGPEFNFLLIGFVFKWSQWRGLNARPTVYETVALPLSYIGLNTVNTSGSYYGRAKGPGKTFRNSCRDFSGSNFDVSGSKPGKGSSRCRGAARSCLPGSGCAQIACSRICASSSGVRAIGFAFMLLAWEAFSTTSALCSRVMP